MGTAGGVGGRYHFSSEDYDRAAWFRTANMGNWLPNGVLQFRWFSDGAGFWYRRTLANGRVEFIAVEAETGVEGPAFDTGRLAKALTKVLQQPVDQDRLPLVACEIENRGGPIGFQVGTRSFRYFQADDALLELPVAAPARFDVSLSPNGRWTLMCDNYNIALSSLETGEMQLLTTDGVSGVPYGAFCGNHPIYTELQWKGVSPPPSVLWSHDSKRILIQRIDERNVEPSYLVQSKPFDGARPKLHRWLRSLPEDPHSKLAQVEYFIATAPRSELIKIDISPQQVTLMSAVESGDAWWSSDCNSVFFLTYDRYWKSVALVAVDAGSGRSRTLISETTKTFILPSMMGGRIAHTLSDGRVLWLSERTGWRHLYLYSAEGELLAQLTHGNWTITRLLRVDEARGDVIIAANGRENGRDPYYSHIYAVTFEGEIRLLTPEDACHSAALPENPLATTFSPTGDYFIDSHSVPDRAPVHVLRHRDGRQISVIERCQFVGWKGGRFPTPQRVKFKAADGHTDIYGAIYRPSSYRSDGCYPVLDAVYPGPLIGCVSASALPAMVDFNNQSIAELGFIVLALDGRGTPGRSREFLDYIYGRLELAGGLEDHVAAFKQLPTIEPAADLDRVAVCGFSGGGYGALRYILDAPQLYKVAISAMGNHVPAIYTSYFADLFIGPDDGKNIGRSDNGSAVERLKGKLLLVHGEMDSNVQPAHTLRIVDSLIGQNKDFDLLIVPNAGHAEVFQSDYVIRRCWDFLVRNLADAEPPRGYDFPTRS